MLRKRMEECVDGEYQDFKSKNGAYVRQHFFGKYPETAELVKDWSDDRDLGAAPRRLRSGQGLCRLRCRREACRPADRHSGQDGEGLRHGRGGRGPEHHSSAEEDGARSPAQIPRSLRHPGLGREDRGDPIPPPPGRQRGDEISARATDTARGFPAPAPSHLQINRGARVVGIQRAARQHRDARDLDHHGLRAHPQHPSARQGDRQVHRTDCAGRIAHLRHGRNVPPARHLLAARPALPSAGRRSADVLPRGQVRADAAGGHQRGRRHVLVDCRGDVLQHEQCADDPVLHLLFDVRAPTRGRSRLGGWRHALPWIPAGRHRRTNDAQRRRIAARGRAQPCARGDNTQLRLV